MTLHSTRNIEFKCSDGIELIIGRSVRGDSSKQPDECNLIFDDEELSLEHAKLVVKRLPPTSAEESLPLSIDSFRIYLESLGDSDRIVDLESTGSSSDHKVIDLKNGDRFGLVKLDEPVSLGQQRGAKLKFNLNIRPGSWPFSCKIVLTDVSDLKSPCASRASDFLDSIIQEISDDSDSENAWSRASDWIDEVKLDSGKNDAVVAHVQDSVPNVTFMPISNPNTLGLDNSCSASDNSQSDTCIHIDSDAVSECDGTGFVDVEKERHHKYRNKRLKTRSKWSTFRINKARGKSFNKKKRFDLYSGSLGFVIGSIGTLSVLTAVANLVER
ncbi:unnamed protein product [Kluyveromyces dobzhanskii CBS 2104]|uniref:WGS project CCBQ000000000 data, contig 00011 n=1 Tax=Kluyveromyces dobzhanskii CBS 2104 TaxID=1427455 RepID=A0A0A8L7C9_9SACH|nr:unnamed protein product [Kluyveromyces dobzhanskii CBS 2104]